MEFGNTANTHNQERGERHKKGREEITNWKIKECFISLNTIEKCTHNYYSQSNNVKRKQNAKNNTKLKKYSYANVILTT